MSHIFLALYDFSGGFLLLIGLNFFLVLVLNTLIVSIEAIVLRKMNYGGLLTSLLTAFVMNLTSTLAGYGTAYIVLSWSESYVGWLAIFPGFMIAPPFKLNVLQVLLFFGVGYVLTVVLEMGVLLILRREHSPNRIGKMVLVANLFSYLFLIIVFGLATAYFSSSVR